MQYPSGELDLLHSGGQILDRGLITHDASILRFIKAAAGDKPTNCSISPASSQIPWSPQISIITPEISWSFFVIMVPRRTQCR
ncbi:MAG: hypothetical protein JXR80_11230 [Deltaproteobacteria bacterium]|nr:hypothetical protein [Deltaproteobacteria bacterium]